MARAVPPPDPVQLDKHLGLELVGRGERADGLRRCAGARREDAQQRQRDREREDRDPGPVPSHSPVNRMSAGRL